MSPSMNHDAAAAFFWKATPIFHEEDLQKVTPIFHENDLQKVTLIFHENDLQKVTPIFLKMIYSK